MSNRSISDLPLRLFERGVLKLARVFSEADSLETYQDRGYALLGVLLLTALALLWGSGLLSGTVGGLPDSIQQQLDNLSNIFGKSLPKGTPVLLLITLAYAIGLLRANWRRYLGERTINFVIWVFDKAIRAGEFFIEWRRLSMVLIMSLLIFLTWGLIKQTQQSRQRAQVEQNFRDWLATTNDFVLTMPLTRAESARYKNSRGRSQEAFAALSAPPLATAKALRDLLDLLHLNATEQRNYRSYLSGQRARIEELQKAGGAQSLPGADEKEVLARLLINLTLGRIYVRLSHDCQENKPYQACPDLAKAGFYFGAARAAIEEPNFEQMMQRLECSPGKHRAAAFNGLGTVYANAMAIYLRNEAADLQSPEASAPCGNVKRCAEEAYNHYLQAGQEYEKDGCASFEYIRMVNNLTDLLIKIGVRYDQFRRHCPTNLGKLAVTRQRLAETIETQTRKLTDCYSQIPITAIFVTAAQAYGTRVLLNGKGEDGLPDKLLTELKAAALYLRLSYSFEPTNWQDWDLEPFCFERNSPLLAQRFAETIQKDFPRLPALDFEELELKLEQLCQP